MTKFRTAVIGCGMIGSRFASDPKIKGVYSHAGAYDACLATTLVAVCDADELALKQCAQRWGVAGAYRKVSELLNEESPELVSICTPDASHADILRTILPTQSVRGLLVEKPLALDLVEAREMVMLAADRGIVLGVNYSRRYSAGHRRVGELIRSGGLGEIQTVSGYYTKGVLHNGTHWFDLARFLVGEIVVVQGFVKQKIRSVDPTLDVRLTFDSGASGSLQSCQADAFSIFEMDILGSAGRIRLTESGHQIEHFTVADSPFYSGYSALQYKDHWDGELNNTLLHAVQDLADCVAHGGVPRCTGADGIAALAIGIGAIESARTGAPVILNTELNELR